MPRTAPSITGTLSTQADVASYCGVSRSTVAAVLRGDPSATGVNAQTHQRVTQAIAKLGYRRNAAALSLRSGRTHGVAIAVPNMCFTKHVMASMIMSGIGSRAMELGYAFTIACYAEQDVRGSFQRLLRESRFDGVFILSLNEELLDPRSLVLTDLGVPYVALESETAGASSVNFDNVGGARAITEHLLKLGRRRIAFLGYKANAIWSTQRYEGYCQAHKAAGIKVDPKLVIPLQSDLTELGGLAVRQLMDEKTPFDALWCISDLAALAAIRALTVAGIKVPQDVAVCGYDDMITASLVTPALTTIRQDGQAMGELAMEMLHEQITRRAKPRQERLPVKLVVRESCGAAAPWILDVR